MHKGKQLKFGRISKTNANFRLPSLYLELNGGHESHQNLWMTYENGNFTGWQSLETVTVLYISFLVI